MLIILIKSKQTITAKDIYMSCLFKLIQCKEGFYVFNTNMSFLKYFTPHGQHISCFFKYAFCLINNFHPLFFPTQRKLWSCGYVPWISRLGNEAGCAVKPITLKRKSFRHCQVEFSVRIVTPKQPRAPKRNSFVKMLKYEKSCTDLNLTGLIDGKTEDARVDC